MSKFVEKILKEADQLNQNIVKFIEENILHSASYWDGKRVINKSSIKLPGYKREFDHAYILCLKYGVELTSKIYRQTRLYTGTHYGRMNNSLRNDKLPKDTELIDKYITVIPKYKGNTLYRGISKEYWNYIINQKKFTEKSFISTTTDLSTAEYFSKKNGKGGVLFLTGIKNTAAIAPISIIHAVEDSESEYILPRNLSFKVLEVNDNYCKCILI